MRVPLSALLILSFGLLAFSADIPKGPQPFKLGGSPKKTDASKAKVLEPIARLTAFNSWVTSVAFSPDGKWLAAGEIGRAHV